MKLGELLIHVEELLYDVSPSWKAEARTIICHVLGIEPIDLVLSRDRHVTDPEVDKIMTTIKARINRVPLQYTLAKQDFFGLELYVDDNVLIPRPETEMLVEFVVDSARRIVKGEKGRILDIGVGSGAIVIALATRLQTFEFVGCDIDEGALSVAKRNGVKHGVNDRIQWIKSDLFERLPSGKMFDLIVSNPPYIPESDKLGLEPEVVDHEPHLALFGGPDGLDFYRRIIPEALPYLVPGGMVAFEAGHDQYLAIEALFKTYGYVEIGHFEDLARIPRFIYGRKAPIGG